MNFWTTIFYVLVTVNMCIAFGLSVQFYRLRNGTQNNLVNGLVVFFAAFGLQSLSALVVLPVITIDSWPLTLAVAARAVLTAGLVFLGFCVVGKRAACLHDK